MILATAPYKSNAHLIEAIGRGDLPYLMWSARTLDLSYGRGNFWSRWRPRRLVGADIEWDWPKTKRWSAVPLLTGDATAPPFRAGSFDVVVWDGPYKLNGTPAHASDRSYGVHKRMSRDQRHHLILAGMASAAELTRPGGYVLVKCQAQVEGGRVRWQDDMVSRLDCLDKLGLDKVDRFDVLGYRPQPPRPCRVCERRGTVERHGWSIVCPRCGGEGRAVPPQEHAARNSSHLFIFERVAA